MAKFKIAKGTRDRSFPVYAWNSGTGSPFGGLSFNTVGFSGEYRREYQSTWQNITLASGALGAYISGGFIIDGGLVGRYQFSPPNDVFATGNDRWAQLCLYGPPNLLPILCEIELDELDYQNRQNLGVVNISGAPQVTGPIHVAVTGYAANMDPGSYVLATPSWKLKTDPVGGAVVSGKPFVQLNPADLTTSLTVTVSGYSTSATPEALILVNRNNKIDTNSLGQVVMSGNVGATITGQLNVLVTGYTLTANPTTLLLVNPANKLLTNVNGYVVPSGKPNVSLLTTDISGPLVATVSGYSVGLSPSEQVLITSGNKLKTTSLGLIQMDMTQLVPSTNTHSTVGDALNAARAAGFGKWVLNTGTEPPTLDIYSGSNSIIKSFTLDSISTPTTRY